MFAIILKKTNGTIKQPGLITANLQLKSLGHSSLKLYRTIRGDQPEFNAVE